MRRKTEIKNLKKQISREAGLEIASIFGRELFGVEDLHYGYWTDDLDVSLDNLKKAQENYTRFLISNIPPEVETILDVGCGTGKIAKLISEAGVHVDCVSPSEKFAEVTRDRLGNGNTVFECYYENLDTEKKFDMILFSESFQYINVSSALEKSISLLNKNGYILICDVFKNPGMKNNGFGKCPISGGHSWSKFESAVKEKPLELLKEINITEQTAGNIDLEDKMYRQIAKPIVDIVSGVMQSRHSLVTKLLRWKFRKKIDKIEDKYFSGRRNSRAFRHFKTYKLLLYKLSTS